jgi:hypothetical protein
MVNKTKNHQPDASGQTSKKDDVMRSPYERDMLTDQQEMKPREIMKQAASDLERGLVDTDLRGMRGVEKVAPVPPGSAQPIPAQPIPKKGKQ